MPKISFKPLIYAISAFILMSAFTIFCSSEVKAGLYLDAANNIHLDTVDKKRTSSIWYKTIGFTAIECGTPENPAAKIETSNQSGELYFTGTSISEDSYSQFNSFETMPIKDVAASMGASVVVSGSVADRVEKALKGTGPGMWMRLDCIMVIFHGQRQKAHLYTNVGDYNRNPAEIMAAEAWANPSGLKTHFKRYIYIGKQPDENPPQIEATGENEQDWQVYDKESEHTKGSEHPKVDYATGNNGSPYDLNEGIPSGKGLVNDYYASEWYGETSVWARTKTSDEYMGKTPHIVTYYWETVSNGDPLSPAEQKVRKPYILEDCYDEYDGWHAEGNTHGNGFMGVAVSFQYLTDTSVYDFMGADVYNSAYGGASYESKKTIEAEAVHYPKKLRKGEKPFDAAEGVDLTDYTNYSSTPLDVEKDWNASSQKHINPDLPKKDYRTWSELGLDAYMEFDSPDTHETEEEAEEEAQLKWCEYKRSLREDIFEGTTTRNDRLIVDGRTYMLNNDVVGVYWVEDPGSIPYWEECENTAGTSKFIYGKIGEKLSTTIPGREEDSQDVVIDETKPNGAYSTGLKAVYARIVRADSADWTCYARSGKVEKGEWFTNGEISADTMGGPNSLSDNHLTGNNQSNDGVIQVHTPIVSPIKVQTVGAKDNREGEVNPNTQQCHQINDVTQLRLDEDYIIDWVTLGQEDVHREISEYGQNSGMKYEEYVEAKYVCFPFDVVYNGVFYEAKVGQPSDHKVVSNVNGTTWNVPGDGKVHTEWIRLEEPSSWNAAASVAYTSAGKGICGNQYFKDVKEVVAATGSSPAKYSGTCTRCGRKYDVNPATGKEDLQHPLLVGVEQIGDTYHCSFSCINTENENTGSYYRNITSTNHWRKTPFYIPSYAKEIFGSNKNSIYCRVEAYNVNDAFGKQHSEEYEEQHNKQYTYDYYDDGAMYVATYKIDCQLSGWIYDFTVTGTSDLSSFMANKSLTDTIESAKMAFCKYKWDKKLGVLNRLGTPYLRYRRDGSTITPYPYENTLVLTKGKSNQWTQMGSLPKGTQFSYSFKTIANLNNNNDSVHIKPSFRYINENGKKYDMDEILVYYNAKNENPFKNNNISGVSPNKLGEKDVYVQYGSDKDNANAQYVKLADEEFDYSYYSGNVNKTPDTWRTLHLGGAPLYTAQNLGISEQEFMQRETICYTMSNITLNPNLRMFSGEFEQLKTNELDGYSFGNAAFSTYGDIVHKEYDTSENNYDEEKRVIKHSYVNSEFYKLGKIDDFMKSMQTWFGQYYVPSSLYVVTKDSLQRAGVSTDLAHFDLYQYINSKGGIKEGDPIFEPNSGYLVVNFKIVTYMGGDAGNVPHLAYFGGEGGSDGWNIEGFDYKQDINEDGKIDPEPDKKKNPDILESGDVVVIDLSKTLGDMYTSGIFNIN